MNILNKVTLQSMKKSRTRTIVTVLGVILSSAMITAVATVAVSLQNYLINGAVTKYGGWHVEFLDVPFSFVQERSRDAEAAGMAVIDNIGYARLDGGKNPDKPYLFITGFTKEAFQMVPVNLISGRLPENSSEILIPAHVAANGGVKYTVGDTLSLAVGKRMDGSRALGQHDGYISGTVAGRKEEAFVPDGVRVYRVVGICERPSFEEYFAPGYTVITASEAAVRPDSFSLFVELKNPWKVHAYAAGAAKNFAYVLNDNVLRFMGLSEDRLFNSVLYSVGGILTVLIMISSVFLIYNSFNISLNERIRQFGILSSVGATAKQLQNSVLFEGLVIGAAGIPAGVLAGIGSIQIVIAVVARNFGNIIYDSVPLTLTVSVPAIGAAAVISLITILISAYIPARKAANTPVMESIRQTNEIKVNPADVKTSEPVKRVWGLEGMLALKNFKRNRKRYRSIVLSLTFSLVLFVSASTFGSHLKRAAEQSVVNSDYDICFYTQDMEEEELFGLYDELKTADGVYASSYQAILSYSCAADQADFTEEYREIAGFKQADASIDLPMDIQFVEDSVYLQFLKSLGLPTEEYIGENGKMTAVAKAKGGDQKTSKNGKNGLIDLFAKQSMKCRIAPETEHGMAQERDQFVDITFVDTIPVDTLPVPPSEVKPYVFSIVAPYQLKAKFDSGPVRENMGLTFQTNNPTKSTAEMESIIKSRGVTSEYTLYNVHHMLEQNRNMIFVVDVFTYVFVVMISLIAAANVFNTISTNIRLRRRELAMLRSVGMSEREFKKMMNFECVFFGVRTLLFGLPTAGILSCLIYRAIVAGGATVGYEFPWRSMAVSVSGVFLIVFISMLYAVKKIKNENIIDALRDDMT